MSFLEPIQAEPLTKYFQRVARAPKNIQHDENEIKKLARRLRKLQFIQWSMGFLSLILAVAAASTWVTISKASDSSNLLLFYIFVLSFSIFVVCVTLFRLIQSGARWFIKAIPDITLTQEAENIIERLRNGDLRAHFVTRSPTSSKAAFRAPDGEQLGREMSSRVFQSLFCPLLLLDEPDCWHFVLANYYNVFSGIRDRIYVQPPTIDIAKLASSKDVLSDEQVSCPIYVEDPSKPVKSQKLEPAQGPDTDTKIHTMPPVRSEAPSNSRDWLLEMNDQVFQTGLSKYLETVEPHKQAWEESVLIEGRRALQRGFNQTDSIREILAVIRRGRLNNHGPAKGRGESTIKQRLQGKRGKEDIRGYFYASTT